MTVGYHSSSVSSEFTANTSWSHAGPADCRGVLVLTVQAFGTLTEDVSAVTYGGTSLSHTPSSPFLGDAGTEDAKLTAWFLGTSVPDGTQTVSITSNGTDPKIAVVFAFTATGNTEVVDDATLNSASQANPSVALSFTGKTAYCVAAIHSGQGAVTAIAPGTGYTDVLEYDFGQQLASFIRLTASTATDSSTPAWTVAADEVHALAVAIAEVASGTSVNAGEIAVTSTANSATSRVEPAPTGATVSASANNPTITTGKNVDAVTATSTVSAGDLSAKTSPTVGAANVSGTAQNATISTSRNVNATEATATGAAQNASVSTSQNVNATEATASAAAQNASGNVQPASTYDGVVLSDTPVSFWNDDTGTDAIGLSNLTKFNSPTSGQAPDGTACMVFNGTNQYAEGTDQDAYSVPTTGRLTYEAWIRPDTLEFPTQESTGYVHWAGKTGSGATNDAEWQMRMYSKTTTDDPPRPNRISGYAYNPTGGQGTGGYFQDPVVLGEWIHVVFVINKADAGGSYPNGYGKLYKNGVLRRQDDLNFGGTPINPGNGTAPFRIGSARAQSSFFKGAIAKSAIYNYELSQAQITEHFNAMELAQGLAQDATIATSPGPSAATAAGSANNASVSTTGGTNVQAQVASATATAESTSSKVEPTATPATTTGSAQNIAGTTGTSEPATATASATAQTPQVKVFVNAGSAEAIADGALQEPPTPDTAFAAGTAYNPQIEVRVNGGNAAASGSAENATVTTGSNTNAQAQVAGATVTAEGVSSKVEPVSQPGGVAGAAQDASSKVSTDIAAITVAGSANNATISTANNANVFPPEASATGLAVNPSISTSETGDALEATASAIASNPSISTSETGDAGVATATGSANNATIDFSIRASAQEAGASGSANNATIKVSPNLSAAEMAAIAENAIGAITQYAFAQTAGATGTANDTSTTRTGNANAQLAAAIGEALAIKATIGADGATALGAGVAWPPFKITGGVEVATSVMAVRDDSAASDLVSAGVTATGVTSTSNEGVSVLSTNTSTSTVTD